MVFIEFCIAKQGFSSAYALRTKNSYQLCVAKYKYLSTCLLLYRNSYCRGRCYVRIPVAAVLPVFKLYNSVLQAELLLYMFFLCFEFKLRIPSCAQMHVVQVNCCLNSQCFSVMLIHAKVILVITNIHSFEKQVNSLYISGLIFQVSLFSYQLKNQYFEFDMTLNDHRARLNSKQELFIYNSMLHQ